MEYFIAGIVIYILFFIMCYVNTGTDKKNMISFYSYPDAIQQQIKQNEELKIFIPKEKTYLQSFISNFIIFFVVFIITGAILQCFDFKEAVVVFLLMGEGLNLFDFLIIDCCWFIRSKRTRFSSVDIPQMYIGYQKHFISFIKGIPVFIAVAFAVAGVLSLLG